MLLASYATAIVIALRLPGVFCAPVMVGGHAVLAAALLLKVRQACLPDCAPLTRRAADAGFGALEVHARRHPGVLPLHLDAVLQRVRAPAFPVSCGGVTRVLAARAVRVL